MTLCIEGPEDEKLRFFELVQDLDFNEIVPEPELKGEVDSDGTPLWYHWRIENWGTKWNISQKDIEKIGDGIIFDTDLLPPIGIFIALSERFSTLKLQLLSGDPYSQCR